MKKRDAEKAIAEILDSYAKASGKRIYAVNIDVATLGVTKITDPPGAGITYSVELDTNTGEKVRLSR